MEIYVIRHAQSVNNILADERYRVCDPPLTGLGERQAELLAEHLAGGWQPLTWSPAPLPPELPRRGMVRAYGLTRLYCSPMLRSLQTAQAIGRAVGLTPEVWIEVHEQGGMFLAEGEGAARVSVGQPGMTRSEILARFPDFVLPEGITDQGWYTLGYEEWPLCHNRARLVADTLNAWAAAGSEQRIAIVSHGGFADALLKALLHGGPVPGENGHRTQFFYLHLNTAIDRLDIAADGHRRVGYLNRVEHLPPDMMS